MAPIMEGDILNRTLQGTIFPKHPKSEPSVCTDCVVTTMFDRVRLIPSMRPVSTEYSLLGFLGQRVPCNFLSNICLIQYGRAFGPHRVLTLRMPGEKRACNVRSNMSHPIIKTKRSVLPECSRLGCLGRNIPWHRRWFPQTSDAYKSPRPWTPIDYEYRPHMVPKVGTTCALVHEPCILFRQHVHCCNECH